MSVAAEVLMVFCAITAVGQLALCTWHLSRIANCLEIKEKYK